MQLSNGVEVTFAAGMYIFNASMSAGTLFIEMAIDGGDFVLLDETNLNVSGNGIMTLPICKIKATITGDAEVHVLSQDNRPNNIGI